MSAAEDAVFPQFIFAQFAAHFDVVVFTVLLRRVKAIDFHIRSSDACLITAAGLTLLPSRSK